MTITDMLDILMIYGSVSRKVLALHFGKNYFHKCDL